MKLIKNTVYNISFSIVSFFCSIILSIVVARKLLPEAMGTYSYYMWLLSIGITFSSLGIPNTITKYVAQFFLINKDYVFLVLRTLFRYQVFMFALVSLLILMGLIDSLLLYILIIFGLLLNIINIWLKSYSSGIQKFFEISISSSFTTILEVIVIFVLLSFFKKWWAVFIVHIFVVLLNNFLMFFLLKKDLNFLKQKFNLKTELKDTKVREYLLLVSLMIVADVIVWQKSEIFFLKIFGSFKDVAFYSIAFSLAYLPLRFLTAPIGSVLMPYISTLYGKDELENSKTTCYYTMKYIIFILLPVVVFCFFFSDKIVELLYGIDYIKSASVLRILLLSALIGGIAVPTSALVQALEMMRFAVGVNLFVGMVNISLDLLLIPKYNIIGAAVANSVSQVLGCIIGFVWLYKMLNMKYPIKELLFLTLILLPLGYMLSFFVPQNFFDLILIFIAFFILYLFIAFFTRQLKSEELKEIFIKWKREY